MKYGFVLVLLSLITQVAIACDSLLPLYGTVSVPACLTGDQNCIPASRALYEYIQAQPDDSTSFSIALHTSPWRFYDPKMRIITVEEMAERVRAKLEPKNNRVELLGSWTSVAPSQKTPSLATRLSKALDGFPVTGMDGFLWMDHHGTMRTTRQAFTVRHGGGQYSVKSGEEVLVPLTIGWAAGLEDKFGPKDGEMMLQAGVGNDVFLLCPDGALADFEAAAKMGSAIAAYNAALMRLERSRKGDLGVALKLLEQAVSLGDGPATAKLKSLRQKR